MEVFILAGVTILFAFFFSGIYSFTQLWVTLISSLVLLRLIRTSASNAVNKQINARRANNPQLVQSDSEENVISIQKEMIEIEGISDSASNPADKISHLVTGLEHQVTKGVTQGVTTGITGVLNIKDSIINTTEHFPNILSRDNNNNFNNITDNNNNNDTVNEKKKLEMPIIGSSLPIPDIRVRSPLDIMKGGKKDKSKKEKELEFTFGNEQIEKKASDGSIIESDISLKDKKKDSFGFKKIRDQLKSSVTDAEDHLRSSFNREEKKGASQSSENLVASDEKEEKKEDLRSTSEKHPIVDTKEEKKGKKDGEKKALGEGLMGKFGLFDRKSKSPRKEDKQNLLANNDQSPLSKSQEVVVNPSEKVIDNEQIIKEAQENSQPESTRRNTFISSQRIPEAQRENNTNNIIPETSSNILHDDNNNNIIPKANSLDNLALQPVEKKEKSLGHGFIKDVKKMMHIGHEDEKAKKEKEEEKERKKEKEKEEAERQKRHKEEMEFLEKREEFEKKKEKEEKRRSKEKERLEKEQEELKKEKEEAELYKRHKEELEFLEKREELEKKKEKEAHKKEGEHHHGPAFLFDEIKKLAHIDDKKKKEGEEGETDEEVKLRKESKKKEKKEKRERRKSHRKSLDIPKTEDASGPLKVSRSVMANLDGGDHKSELLDDAEEKLSHEEKVSYLSKSFIKGSFKKLVHHEKKDGEEKSPKKSKNLLKKSRSITQIANSDSSTDLSGELLSKEEKATALQKEFFKESMKEFIPTNHTSDQQSTPDKKKKKDKKDEEKKEEKEEEEEKEKVDKKSGKLKSKLGRMKNFLT